MKTTMSFSAAPRVTTPPLVEGSCPGEEEGRDDGWVKFGSYCYYFARDAAETWINALRQCHYRSNNAAELVSIHSEVENNFVRQTMGDDVRGNIWTGFHRSQRGKWHNVKKVLV